MIKTRGEKVSPREVEEALYGLDGVAEAAVIGVPDSVLGNAVKAILIRKPGANLSTHDVIRHCARRARRFHGPENCGISRFTPENGIRQGKQEGPQGQRPGACSRIPLRSLGIGGIGTPNGICEADHASTVEDRNGSFVY